MFCLPTIDVIKVYPNELYGADTLVEKTINGKIYSDVIFVELTKFKGIPYYRDSLYFSPNYGLLQYNSELNKTWMLYTFRK
ncbi:MAG: hypothetical protein H6607_12235 [Flavobacteriales bacterium]|nr:hypothetical protein [Flavobacteriales bacterium]